MSNDLKPTFYIEKVIILILILFFVAGVIFVLFYDTKDLGACEALGGVYIYNACIDASAVIELPK